MFSVVTRRYPFSPWSGWTRVGLGPCFCGFLVSLAVLPPAVGVAQLPTSHRFGTNSPGSNTLSPASSKVVNIYPINGRLTRQDPVEAGADHNFWDGPTWQPALTPPTPPQEPGQSGQPLPGLPDQFGLQIPADLVEPEVLPDSRETASHEPRFTGVSWVGLKERARPRPAATTASDGRSLVHDRPVSRPLSYSVRRPSPPPPVINVFQPALVQIPFQVQVVPMYVEHYPTWFSPATPWPHHFRHPHDFGHPRYFGQPSVVPVDPTARPNYYDTATSARPTRYRHPDGLDPRIPVPTDQPMFFLPDVNLVPQQSNSVDFVSFPHNVYSYPRQQGYGVNFQTFPVHRRLP
jgi:hypothetical protein